jgi:ribonuclease VapC
MSAGCLNDRRGHVRTDCNPRQRADATLYAEAIAEADPPLISAATLLELNIVMLNRHGIKAARMVDRLIQEGGFQVESFTIQHAELAREAYARYGKGQQTAALNYGDCFSYALAKATGLPLLFKGQDFSKTDIMPAEIGN